MPEYIGYFLKSTRKLCPFEGSLARSRSFFQLLPTLQMKNFHFKRLDYRAGENSITQLVKYLARMKNKTKHPWSESTPCTQEVEAGDQKE